MVLYFSGTGNSRYVAEKIADILKLEHSFIPETNPADLKIPEKHLIFVFPVYSWGVPPVVNKFIEEIPAIFWEELKAAGVKVDCVMTCGDEVALAPEMIIKAIAAKGITLNSVRSVIMPNNYVLLPGFDVDKKDVEDRKLNECQKRITDIAGLISKGQSGIDVIRGNIPFLKSKVVYPLFKKWGIFPKNWHYSVNCISCGRCEKICPMKNVRMTDGHPEWGSSCCSCLACYHICPVHSVEYAKETLKKGQYMFPSKKFVP